MREGESHSAPAPPRLQLFHSNSAHSFGEEQRVRADQSRDVVRLSGKSSPLIVVILALGCVLIKQVGHFLESYLYKRYFHKRE